MTTENCIRVTHREREAAAEELRTAYAVGCLDNEELEDRISRAYAAKFRDDLAALTRDLPAVPPDEREWERAARPAPADLTGRARAAFGSACWLSLAAAGSWLIAVTAGGLAAVLLIFAWLALLQVRGRLPQWWRRAAAAVLISRVSSLTSTSAPGTAGHGQAEG